MSRYNQCTFLEKDLDMRVCKSRDSYRVRVYAPENIDEAFKSYADNFYMAAHQIASYLLETDNTDISELDTFFFSLAFLYRHSIELILKAIAFQNIIRVQDRVQFVKATFHNLEEIIAEIEKISSVSRSQDEIDWLKEYFASISEVDKKSDSFRYPFHIYKDDDIWGTGEYSIQRIFEKQTHIDLVKFANKFEAAYEILKLWYNNDSNVANEWKEVSPVFLEEGGYYYGQAVVGYAYSRADFYPYTKAYSETAGYLRSYMQQLFMEKKYLEAEKFFLPMCYLYRNCVELGQKAIWFEETGVGLQTRCKVMKDNKHSIRAMWDLLKEYVISCGNGSQEDDDYVQLLEKYCYELHDYDSDASRFRYPVNKDMVPYFGHNKWFDFAKVSKYFEGIINAFDGIDAALNARNEYIAEMEAEYRAEMEAEYRAERAYQDCW